MSAICKGKFNSIEEQQSLRQNERKQVFNASSQQIIAQCFGFVKRGSKSFFFFFSKENRKAQIYGQFWQGST